MDDVIATLDGVLAPDIARLSSPRSGVSCEVFSHRHATELYVFGVTAEIDNPASDFRLLLLRVAISCAFTESIVGEVLWFRSRKEFGRVDLKVAAEGFTQEGLSAFKREWPRLLEAFESAVSRKVPLCAA